MLDQAAISAANFGTGVLIARACGRAELGLYMLGYSISILLVDIQNALIATPYMIRCAALRGGMLRRATGSVAVHGIVFAAAAVLCVVGCIGAIPLDAMRSVGLPLAAALFFTLLRENARRISLAQLRIREALILDCSTAALQLGVLGLIWWHDALSAQSAFLVVAVATAASSIGWWLSDKARLAISVEGIRQDLVQSWVLGRWVLLSGLTWTASTTLYPWVLAQHHGAESAGTWAACVGVVALGNPIMLGVQNLLGPKIVHRYTVAGAAAMQQLIGQTSTASALAVAPVCGALVIAGEPLLEAIYGGAYSGNGPVVGVLAANLLVMTAAVPISRGLFALRRTDADAYVNVIALAAFIFLGLPAAAGGGPLGASLGMLLGTGLSAAVRYVVLRHYVTRTQRVCR